MTVRELIEHLKTFDPDALVYLISDQENVEGYGVPLDKYEVKRFSDRGFDFDSDVMGINGNDVVIGW